MHAHTQSLINTLRRSIGSNDLAILKDGGDALSGLEIIILNMENEAATATARLEAAKGSVKIYAKAAGYEGLDSLSGFAEHLKELVDGNKAKATHITNLNGEIGALQNQLREAEERNKTQAEYFDKLCAITGSPSDDLDKLVADVKNIHQWKDEWCNRAHKTLEDNELLTKQLTEAQQQSQPQPPNSYLAKEIDRLEAEARLKDAAIAGLQGNKQYLEAVLARHGIGKFGEAEGQPLPCHTLQTHQSDPAEEIQRDRDFFRKQAEALLAERNAARDEANSLRAERDRYAKIIDRL